MVGDFPSDDEFILKNRSLLSAAHFVCTAFLREDGVVIAKEPVKLPPALPGEMTKFTFAIAHEKKPGCEYHLDFKICRKEKPWYSDADDSVSWTQFALKNGGLLLKDSPATGKVETCETEDTVCLSAGSIQATFSKDGILQGLQKDGKNLLWKGEPNFTRPRSGLDAKEGWGWDNCHNRKRVRRSRGYQLYRGEHSAEIVFPFTMEDVETKENVIFGTVRYVLHGDGTLHIHYTSNLGPDILSIPRTGLSFVLPEGFEQVTYFGRGEVENYPDRKEAAKVGVYTTTVDAMHFGFLPPSENGGHEDTRYVKLSDGEHTVKITGEVPFHFDVKHNSAEDYAVLHEHELCRRPETYLNLDAAHGPIGSRMAWSTAMDPYLAVGSGRYSAGFVVEIN